MEGKRDFQIVFMLKERGYGWLFFFVFILVLFLYPFFQIIGVLLQNPGNFLFAAKNWFSSLTPLRWAFYFLYGILFSLTISFFLWQRKRKICPPKVMKKSGIWGVGGAVLGPALPLCPACFPVIALFLPFSTFLLLIKYSIFFMGGSIVFLFFSLWLLGAFRRKSF